jgi:predicted PurR-regulated permease PerM
MLNRAIVFFLLVIFPRTSLAADMLKELIKSVQDLTVSLNSTEVDLNKISALGQQVLDFAHKNERYLSSVTELSSAINALNESINNHVPTAEVCLYTVGTSVVVASLICTVPQLIRFCQRYKRKGAYLDDGLLNN